jgi:hypothetical protein
MIENTQQHNMYRRIFLPSLLHKNVSKQGVKGRLFRDFVTYHSNATSEAVAASEIAGAENWPFPILERRFLRFAQASDRQEWNAAKCSSLRMTILKRVKVFGFSYCCVQHLTLNKIYRFVAMVNNITVTILDIIHRE